MWVVVPNFVPIDQIADAIWRFIILRFSKMAAVRHLGFVLRKLWPATKSAWWSLSLRRIWLKSMQYKIPNFYCFGSLAWKRLLSPPKWSFCRLWPDKCYSQDSQKDTSSCKSTLLEPISVKIGSETWLTVTKKQIDRWTCERKINMEMRLSTHAQIRKCWIDWNQILHIDSLSGHSNTFKTVSRLVQGFWSTKLGLSHWLQYRLRTLRTAPPCTGLPAISHYILYGDSGVISSLLSQLSWPPLCRARKRKHFAALKSDRRSASIAKSLS